MREFITISLGPLSNFTSTHFWNFQDEWLKQETERNPVLYYETSKTQQYVPRSIFIDFRNNFGNFLSCFSMQQTDPDKEMEFVQSSQWQGKVKVAQQDQIKKSQYQNELDEMEEEDKYEDKKRVEEKMYQDEDDEDEDGGSSKQKFQQMMKDYKNNSQNLFMQLMQQEQDKQEEIETQIDTSTKKTKKDEEERSLQQYYKDFNFDDSVAYFTDFLQSKMQQQNQLILPNSVIGEDNFQLYNQGKIMCEAERYFKDDCEDRIRNQLEQSDMLQGFQFICDTNSGHGSLAQILITELVKDEAPKAPIILYSLKNENKFASDESEIKQQLASLNQGMWLSELASVCNMFIPLDEMILDENLKKEYLTGLRDKSLYHQSAVNSLIIDNIANQCYSQTKHTDLKDVISKLIYTEQPNMCTAQLQLPYLFKEDQHFLKALDKEQLTKQESYVRFNNLSEQQRQPIRLTYTLRGASSLIDINQLALHQAKDEFERFLFKNIECQRGIVTQFIESPHLMPIPYPRFLTPHIFNEHGILKNSRFKEDDFTSSMPTLLKTTYDSSYSGQVLKALDSIKFIKPSIRQQLTKDCLIEEDELRENREKLEHLYEGLKMLDSTDPDYGNEDDDEDDNDNEEY